VSFELWLTNTTRADLADRAIALTPPKTKEVLPEQHLTSNARSLQVVAGRRETSRNPAVPEG
jgi:hypothetical protein